MNDSEVFSTSTLTSLGASRPRPRRKHKPSTPSALSPTYSSLPSLFDDDQLAAFFPTLSPTEADPPSTPFSAPSVLKNNCGECYRFPSVSEISEASDERCIDPDSGVKEAKTEEKKREVEESGRSREARREDEKGDERAGRDDEKRGSAGGGGGRDKSSEKEEVVRRNDWSRKAINRKGESYGRTEGREHNETRKKKKEEEEDDAARRKEEDNVGRFPSAYVDGDVFYALDDVTRSPPALYPAQPAETSQLRPSSLPTCSTLDSMSDSYYTMDDAGSTDFLSSPQSAAYDDDDLPLKFVFPPKISRLGSIYSHLGLSASGGSSSSSDSESDMCATQSKQIPSCTESEKCHEKTDILDGKHAWSAESEHGKEEADGAACVAMRNPQASSSGQVKKVPPAKPPRLRASTGMRNNADKRRSREDPVRYEKVYDKEKLSSKRSTSMSNILESNLEAPDEKFSRFSGTHEKDAPALLHPPTEAQGVKKDRRERNSFRYKGAAKIVSSIISKKPPFPQFLHRRENSRSKFLSPKKMPNKDVEESPSLSPAPVEHQRQEDVASQACQLPSKPPRKDLDALASHSLDKTQTACADHGALLNFYCVKCRLVVCRDCTVVAHSHGEKHKVLDTMHSLDTLRSEAVAMLRHYTVLEVMHASLINVYFKFKLQHRDANIAAIEQRLEEGKYLADVVKEAEQMVKTCTNLHKIRECVRQWEARQDEWGDLVFLASRCALLADMCIPFDTVLLRMGNWVMATPWIQLSHLLQPYLTTSTVSKSSSSTNTKDNQLTPGGRKEALVKSSPILRRTCGGMSTGGTDKPFPYNARQIVLSNLVPYIILNPDIRYFVQVRGLQDVDVTLVVVPVDDHAHECLKRRRNNATKSPELLRQANLRPPTDAIALVEQQMTCGSCKTRITASSMPLGPSSSPAIVKVSFSDVKIMSDGEGLPAVKGGLKRGDMIVDQNSAGCPTLTVVVRDIGDFTALRLGRVTWGMDGLTCLMGTEDTKRAESSGLRAKIKGTIKREEAMYDVTFGMDL